MLCRSLATYFQTSLTGLPLWYIIVSLIPWHETQNLARQQSIGVNEGCRWWTTDSVSRPREPRRSLEMLGWVYSFISNPYPILPLPGTDNDVYVVPIIWRTPSPPSKDCRPASIQDLCATTKAIAFTIQVTVIIVIVSSGTYDSTWTEVERPGFIALVRENHDYPGSLPSRLYYLQGTTVGSVSSTREMTLSLAR